GQPADIAGQAKLDRVDHPALAGAVRPGDRERSFLKIDIELSDAPDFLDVGGFELYHLMSPPAGSEKTFTNSSAFSFLLSASSFLGCVILLGSRWFESGRFGRTFSAISC